MDLRIYTPEGYRIKIPGGWKNSWATFLDEWGDHMRALATDENWEVHVDQYVPVKLRRRERYVSIRCEMLRCPVCCRQLLKNFSHRVEQGLPVLKYAPYCSKACRRYVRYL